MTRHHTKLWHKTRKKEPIDIIIYFFTIATPLFELPQAIAIYSAKSAANVSWLTWAFFLLADVAWLVYAAKHKLLPLSIMYSFYFLVEAAIVAGIIIYS